MNITSVLANATRRLGSMFPGYFEEAKHDHYKDFGWPVNLDFNKYHAVYLRNGLGRGAIKKTSRNVWQSYPELQIGETEHSESDVERAIKARFEELRVWQKLATAYRRSLVGKYSAVIFRFADGQKFREPVGTVPGGLLGLVEVIPVWEAQLSVSKWDDVEESETYGQPLMYSFNEAAVESSSRQDNKTRMFDVHPDRILIWSEDGTLNCDPFLEAGYNDLLTIEKISGAGGEGFWKNAKAAPVLEVDKEARLSEMAKAMGVDITEIADAMNEQIEDYQKGFDKLIMLQGMTAKQLNVTLPSPEYFREGPQMSFACSIEMPVKILTGMQTGERASKEDASEWAKTGMGIRADSVVPNIKAFVAKLVKAGILTEADWFLKWADLTEASIGDKVDRAYKMADTNAKMSPTGELVFLPKEIRAVVDLEPLSDAESTIEPPSLPTPEGEQEFEDKKDAK